MCVGRLLLITWPSFLEPADPLAPEVKMKNEPRHRTADHSLRPATRLSRHLCHEPRRCVGDASSRSDGDCFSSSPEAPCGTGRVADARYVAPVQPFDSGRVQPSTSARFDRTLLANSNVVPGLSNRAWRSAGGAGGLQRKRHACPGLSRGYFTMLR